VSETQEERRRWSGEDLSDEDLLRLRREEDRAFSRSAAIRKLMQAAERGSKRATDAASCSRVQEARPPRLRAKRRRDTGMTYVAISKVLECDPRRYLAC
jgi:hypothetical protein